METLEESFHLLRRNTVTSVADLDTNAVEGLVGLYLQGHLSILVGIFGGIREKIVDDLIEFVGIDPAHHTLRVAGDGETLAFLYQERFETLGGLVDITHDITL